MVDVWFVCGLKSWGVCVYFICVLRAGSFRFDARHTCGAKKCPAHRNKSPDSDAKSHELEAKVMTSKKSNGSEVKSTYFEAKVMTSKQTS